MLDGYINSIDYLVSMYSSQFAEFTFDSSHPIWQEQHHDASVITASEIPNVFCQGYHSRSAVWAKYAYRKDYAEPSEFAKTLMDHGKDGEEIAVTKMASVPSLRNFIFFRPGMIRHAVHHNIGATVDMIGISVWDETVPMDDWQSKTVGVEVKCPIGDPPMNVEEVKSNYIIQVQIQMACTGLNEIYLFYWYNSSATVYLIKRHQALIEFLLEGTTNFLKEATLAQQHTTWPCPTTKKSDLTALLNGTRKYCMQLIHVS